MKKILKWVGIAVGGIIVISILFSSAGDSETGSSSSTNETNQEKSTEQPSFDTSLPHFENGTHRVGDDIEPGTYRTRESSSGCYYARLSGFGGTFDEIITNDNFSAPAIITISASDVGFESTRCATWTQDLSQITDSKTTFGDGMFIVGTDIEPGTYKNTGQSNCYYERLGGFSGAFGDIIANNNVSESTIVTIAETDEGFKSSNCGTWTKVE